MYLMMLNPFTRMLQSFYDLVYRLHVWYRRNMAVLYVKCRWCCAELCLIAHQTKHSQP